jgi:hypothetical protein
LCSNKNTQVIWDGGSISKHAHIANLPHARGCRDRVSTEEANPTQSSVGHQSKWTYNWTQSAINGLEGVYSLQDDVWHGTVRLRLNLRGAHWIGFAWGPEDTWRAQLRALEEAWLCATRAHGRKAVGNLIFTTEWLPIGWDYQPKTSFMRCQCSREVSLRIYSCWVWW